MKTAQEWLDFIPDKDWDNETALYAAIQTDAQAELLRENAALKVEYKSRAAWIEAMNIILGYDNSDGFHSEPSPHDIARELVRENTELKYALLQRDEQLRKTLEEIKDLVFRLARSCSLLVHPSEKDEP